MHSTTSGLGQTFERRNIGVLSTIFIGPRLRHRTS
jgi:hypothetical protein